MPVDAREIKSRAGAISNYELLDDMGSGDSTASNCFFPFILLVGSLQNLSTFY